jgi:uncharacterized membrane protein
MRRQVLECVRASAAFHAPMKLKVWHSQNAPLGVLSPLAHWNNSIKRLSLALMAQPLLVIAAISPNSNDTQKRGSACLIFALMSLLLAAGAAFYFAADWRLAALAGFVASAVSVFALWLYGRWFNRSGFDLVPLRRTEQE